jgi:hypothetical protein
MFHKSIPFLVGARFKREIEHGLGRVFSSVLITASCYVQINEEFLHITIFFVQSMVLSFILRITIFELKIAFHAKLTSVSAIFQI